MKRTLTKDLTLIWVGFLGFYFRGLAAGRGKV